MNRYGLRVLAAGLAALLALVGSANAAPPPSHNNNPPPPSHNPPGNNGNNGFGNNGNNGNNGFGNNGNNGFGNNGNNGNNGFGNNGNNGPNFNNLPPRLNSNPPPQLSSNPPRLNNNTPQLNSNTPPKLSNSGPKLNNDGPKLTDSNPPPKLNNSGPKLNNDGPKLSNSNTPPKLSNSGPKLNNDGPKLTDSNPPPKLNNSGPKLNNDGPKLSNSNTPPKLSNSGPKLNNDGPKLSNSNTPPKLNNAGPKLNNDGPKLSNSGNGSKLNATGPKLNGNAPPKALTDAKYRPRAELTEKIKQHQVLGLQKNKELGKERGLSLADQNAALKKNATPQQLDKLKTVTQKAQAAQAASLRPSQTGKSLPQKTTVAPQESLSLLGKGDAKTLSNAGKDNPGYQTAMSHLTGKQQLLSSTGYNKGRLLSSTDYHNLQKQLGTTSLNNPNVLIPAHNLTKPVAGASASNSSLKTIINNATDPKSSLTPAQKAVAEKFVLNQPLNAHDLVVANSILNDPKLSPAAKGAFLQMNKDIQKQLIQNDFLNAMQNLTGGGLIPFGSLGGPAGGFTTNDNGDLVASGGDGYPPFMQTTWLSADQSVDTTTALGEDGVPDGPGIDLAVLPGGDSGTAEGAADSGGDADVTLGGLASAAAIEQPTRYLRATNDTDQPVTLYVQYHTMKDDNEWAWYTGNPDADSAQPLEFHLDPGETADLGDNGWRINADKVRIWGASETVAWQNFKDVDLWLVPEVDADGNHGYEDQDVETFSFTLN